ncbi:MAG TPA: DsbE family thiol:disulfide interchange protein [Gammaproteobacteria bacterium]|jgi:cytochrome c biogenesis protein CcmG/thiol:disulfide interchange protein DsbE|nr:DsbE family thiol:disulfide interchange protein [Gammaproteobacteria bacterium]
MKLRYLGYTLPILVLVALLALFSRGLFLNPRVVPSPLIGKAVPVFSLPRLDAPTQTFTQDEFKGKVALLNVWATWCVACRDEHEALVQFAKQNVIPIYGLDYKDERQSALDWLAKEGDPYTAVAFDATGDVAINWGVYGAPETFLLDKHGIIRHKYIGPLTQDIIQHDLLPRIQKLEQAGS